MAVTSQGSTVKWGAVSTSELRSVSVSSDSVSLVDGVTLGTAYKRQLKGQVENPVITVVTLDKPNWTLATVSGTLEIVYGAGATAVNYKNCILSEVSASVGVDAAVEYTYTFTSLLSDASGGTAP